MFGVPLQKLHHAYIIEGGEATIKDILLYLENEDIETVGSPSVLVFSHAHFGIDEARNLKNESLTKGLKERSFFILNIGSISREAEQSLLKLFEEPTSGLHFFIVTPYPDLLLDTLRSRTEIIRGKKETETSPFLQAPLVLRLEIIKELLKKYEDEVDGSTQIRARAIAILNSIEEELWGDVEKSPELRELLKLKEYLHQPSSSVKMILEHLALTLPEIKKA